MYEELARTPCSQPIILDYCVVKMTELRDCFSELYMLCLKKKNWRMERELSS